MTRVGRRGPTIKELVCDALARRDSLIVPGHTDSLRLIHGASDGLAGHYVDRLGERLLVSSKTSLDPEMVESLIVLSGISTVYARRLIRDVRKTRPVEVVPERIAGAPAPSRFPIRENGMTFLASFEEGYSVGIFLDQRRTREQIVRGTFCRRGGASSGIDERPPLVLNTFAYTGSFSVAAAKSGARVTTLDLSRQYLDWGRENFLRNGLDPENHDWIYGDVFDWLPRLAKRGRSYDLVIVDPPTFSASKRSGAFAVERDYGRLARLALRLVAPGGMLLACCNAARLSASRFSQVLATSLEQEGRRCVRERLESQPPEYPVSTAEPAYLKVWWGLVA